MTEVHLQLADGRTLSWFVAQPHKLLQWLSKESQSFERLLTTCLSKHPAMPWHSILYHDEAIPGNVLAADNHRKSHVFYLAFREFEQFLCDELAWLPIAVLRTSVVKQVRGSFGACMRALVRAFVFEANCFRRGEVILVGGQPRFIQAVISDLLLDESAMKFTWDCKGASGIKPCFKCKNVLSKRRGRSRLDSLDNYFVDVSCADSSKFDVLTDEEVWQLVDEIQAATATMSNKQLDRLEKSAGLNFAPYGLLADHEVRSDFKPGASLYDAMHCFYSNGIVGVEVNLFVKSCEKKLAFLKKFWGICLQQIGRSPKRKVSQTTNAD